MRTKKQLWFKTDANFYSTEEKVRNSSKTRNIISHKGRLTFQLVSLPIAKFQVMGSGKVGISFPLKKKPETYIQNLKPLLVREDGSIITKFEKYIEIPKLEEEKTPQLKKVEKTINDLRFILMRNPTPEEIAETVGIIPEKARELAYKSAPKTKWKESSEDDKKKADLKIKEIYQLASLSKHFDTKTILERPATHLGGLAYQPIVDRINHALKSEKDELPKIVFDKETDDYKRFDFKWPTTSRFKFTGNMEFYYKKEKKLSGQLSGMKEIFKEAIKYSKEKW